MRLTTFTAGDLAFLMIAVDQLTKTFPLPGGRELTAVDRVSFSVSAGEVYGLLGPNGAGKTTTIRMLLGLLAPTAGEATVAGFSSRTAPDEVKRRVGLVASHTGVYQYLTAREMLQYFADVYAVPREAAERELQRLTELLGLEEFLDRPCAGLSTGQRQRLNLARSLIHRPPVMLLDEPTLGLDVWGVQVMTEFIGLLRDAGKAVILCTHHLDEAERMCNRFGLMYRGRLAFEGTLRELQEQSGQPNLLQIFLQLSQRASLLSMTAGELE